MKVGGPQRAVAGSRAYSVGRMSDSSSCGRRARPSQLDPQSHLSLGKMSYTVGTNTWPSPRLKAKGNKDWDFKKLKLKQSNALAH